MLPRRLEMKKSFCPSADQLGLQTGDVVLEVDGAPATDLADLFRKIWAVGPAGAEIPLTVLRDGSEIRLRLSSADREDFLKSPQLH